MPTAGTAATLLAGTGLEATAPKLTTLEKLAKIEADAKAEQAANQAKAAAKAPVKVVNPTLTAKAEAKKVRLA